MNLTYRYRLLPTNGSMRRSGIASGALLRSVPWINEDEVSTSPFRLVLDHLEKLRPGLARPAVAADPLFERGVVQNALTVQQRELVPKSLAVRTHACPSCGLVIDRDWNAANNILAAVVSGGSQNVAQWGERAT